MFSQWKKIKKSGHFKRAVKKKYQLILESNSNPHPQCLTSLSICNGGPVTTDVRGITISPNTQETQESEQYNNGKEAQRLEFIDTYFDTDDEPNNSADEESIQSISETDKKIEIKKQLINWAVSFNITHMALRELFHIWNQVIPNLLPKDPRTLLKTPKLISLVTLENGTYWHNGFISVLTDVLYSLENISDIESISLNINIDGLPIHKSSRCEFWPILCNIHEIPEVKPLVIGIYCGTGKPSLKSYLQNFVIEAMQVLNDGIILKNSQGNKKIDVKIRCFICDSPARAFIKGIANFNSKNGCNKCTTTGEYSHLSHTVYFPRAGCDLRTDTGFRSRVYGSHHKSETPLENLPINMVEDFPVGDSLHLIDLGIMKRCLTGWKDGNFGNYSTKWCAKDINLVSKFLLNCKMPSEIHRAVRGLDVLAHWKGTEYRTFLLYISIIILKKVLSNDVYQHFLLLFCAITICSSNAYKHFLPLAESLLDNYVEMYRDFYGEDYMTSNVHNLTHLIHEVNKFGVLSTFNAYPFESRLFFIKNLLRSGNCPLAQVAKRLGERLNVDKFEISTKNEYPELKNIDSHGRFKTIIFRNFSLNSSKNKDKWFLTLKNEVVCMEHIVKANSLEIYGYPVQTENVFEQPIRSSYLNIFKSSGVLGGLKSYLISDIKCKLILILDDNDFVFIPLLHTIYEK